MDFLASCGHCCETCAACAHDDGLQLRIPNVCIVDDGRVVSMQMYHNEAVRVLTSGGHFYISWKPSFQSARGHHIHAMVGLSYLSADPDLTEA